MTRSLSIKAPADIPNAVRTFLGFDPTDSYVVLGIGGGPTARVDIGPAALIAASLVTAAPHWSNGVVAVAYSSDPAALGDLAQILETLDVPVRLAAHVGESTVTVGESTEPYYNGGRSREDVMADVVAAVSDPDEADEEAWRAYLDAGNGALAWLYLDRAEALRGERSQKGADLARYLIQATPPGSITRP